MDRSVCFVWVLLQLLVQLWQLLPLIDPTTCRCLSPVTRLEAAAGLPCWGVPLCLTGLGQQETLAEASFYVAHVGTIQEQQEKVDTRYMANN